MFYQWIVWQCEAAWDYAEQIPVHMIEVYGPHYSVEKYDRLNKICKEL